jgi:DNA-binding GntR family transcriptional regulator
MPLPTRTPRQDREMLRDRAYTMLLDAIRSGELQPGEILPDEDLSQWLNMSRTPIREALIKLAEQGVIEIGAGKPTIVASLTLERTNRALMVSSALNLYAVRGAVGRLSAEQLALLDASSRELATQVAAGHGADAARAVAAFFDVLAAQCDNEVLNEQIDRMNVELALFLRPSGSESFFRPHEIVTGLAQLSASAALGDVDRAIAALDQMYVLTKQNFRHRFRAPALLDPIER